MATRRDFLRGIVAAAVATQLPDLPKASVETLTDKVVNQLAMIQMDGECPQKIVLDPYGGGWVRLIAHFPDSNSGCFHLNFEALEGGGLHIGDGENIKYAQVEQENSGCIFSCFIKADEKVSRSLLLYGVDILRGGK